MLGDGAPRDDRPLAGPLALLCGAPLVILALIWAIAHWGPGTRVFREATKDILTNGQLVKCWIVYANPSLYKASPIGGGAPCRTVFTFEKGVPDLDRRLAQIAQAVGAFAAEVEAATNVERFGGGQGPHAGRPEQERWLVGLLQNLVPNPRPLRLPDRFTDGLKAYIVDVDVQRKYLPEGRLTRPYIYAKALPGQVDVPKQDKGYRSRVLMVPEPAS